MWPLINFYLFHDIIFIFNDHVFVLLILYIFMFQATVSESLPLIMFGAMASSSGLLALAFPETHNTKLPDTIKDALHIGKRI